MRWLLLALAACGRIGFDPLGGAASGDDAHRDSSSSSTCNGTTTGCFSSSIALMNASSGNRSNDLSMFANNHVASCGGPGGDFGTEFVALQAGTYLFTVTASFHTILYALDGDCSGAELACVNSAGSGQIVSVPMALNQHVIVVVDSTTACGPVTLSYSGM